MYTVYRENIPNQGFDYKLKYSSRCTHEVLSAGGLPGVGDDWPKFWRLSMNWPKQRKQDLEALKYVVLRHSKLFSFTEWQKKGKAGTSSCASVCLSGGVSSSPSHGPLTSAASDTPSV